jgi:outer membrane protein TolC
MGRLATATAALLLVFSTRAQAERLTMEEAVVVALRHNLRLRAARERAGGARDVARSVGARLLPSIRLSDQYQHWNCPAAIAFLRFSTGATCLEEAEAQAQAAGAVAGLPPALATAFANPVVARALDTNSFAATVNQPLLGLPRIGFDYAAQRAGAAAAAESVRASEAALAQNVRNGFLGYFDARAAEQIALASTRELEEELRVATARVNAGTLTQADLLRVRVALANARQQAIAAAAQAEVVKATLLDLVGLPPEAAVELVEPRFEPAPAPSASAAMRSAEERRPEVAQAGWRRRAAQRTRTARYLSLLPEADLEGGYIRTDGQLFVPLNQWFVGVRASWALFEWGATFYQARAAAREADAAALEAEDVKRGVAVEVQAALAQLRAAESAVAVAREAIASAEEAYRVEQKLVATGLATTTDLLDAQAALTTARRNLARARYALGVQQVALARAMGQ